MARKNDLYAGKSIQDILNVDSAEFNKLTATQLRQAVSRLASASNKRLRSFASRGEESPATRYVEQSGGAFSTKGKDLNALRGEYVRAKNFLQAKTGSLTGWKRVQSDTIRSLRERGVEVDQKSLSKMWRLYERLKEISPEVSNRKLRYSVLREISNAMQDKQKSANEIISELRKQLNAIYEERSADNESGVSRFFEL